MIFSNNIGSPIHANGQTMNSNGLVKNHNGGGTNIFNTDRSGRRGGDGPGGSLLMSSQNNNILDSVNMSHDGSSSFSVDENLLHRYNNNMRIRMFQTGYENPDNNRRNFNDNNMLSFSTKKDFKTESTELYNLSYQYAMDCLAAGLVYRREFYQDSELEPNNTLMFTITFVPLGAVSTPALNQ